MAENICRTGGSILHCSLWYILELEEIQQICNCIILHTSYSQYSIPTPRLIQCKNRFRLSTIPSKQVRWTDLPANAFGLRIWSKHYLKQHFGENRNNRDQKVFSMNTFLYELILFALYMIFLAPIKLPIMHIKEIGSLASIIWERLSLSFLPDNRLP